MTPRRCPECGIWISDSALLCPHCGACPQPNESAVLRTFVGIIFLLVAILAVISDSPAKTSAYAQSQAPQSERVP
jgi:hypothetical protein